MMHPPPFYGIPASFDERESARIQRNHAVQSRQNVSAHHYARVAASHARAPVGASVVISNPNLPRNIDQKLIKKKEQNECAWTELDMNGIGINNLSPVIANYQFLTILHLGHNHLRMLPPFIANLAHLKSLDVSSNELEELPPELGMLCDLEELRAFDNNLRSLPREFGALYNLKLLGLDGNQQMEDDVIRRLFNDGTEALIAWLRETMPAGLHPPDRVMVVVEDDKDRDDQQASNGTFSILSYNILTQRSAQSEKYKYMPQWALKPSYRDELILSELKKRDADIICLQEVVMSQFNNVLNVWAKEAGYSSIFYQKGRAKIMSESERQTVDGCATFFRTSKFRQVETTLVEYHRIAMERPDLKKSEDMFNRVMPNDSIAILSLFEQVENGNRLVLANTHVHWDPEFADVKLVQVGILMERVEAFAKKHVNSRYPSASQIPLVVCGDFNSTPTSGVYELFAKSVVQPDHADFGNYLYGDYTTEGMSHQLQLKSSYDPIGELPFTNYTPWFRDVLDYIWYSHSALDVLSVLGPIDKTYMSRVVGFPNPHFPSDHIAIMSTLRWKPPRREPIEADFSGRRPNESNNHDRTRGNDSRAK